MKTPKEYIEMFNMTFDQLEEYCFMEPEYIISHADYINWDAVSRLAPIKSFSFKFVKDYIDDWNWDYISAYQNLTLSFIEEFNSFLNFQLLLNNKPLMKNKKADDIVNIFVRNTKAIYLI